MNDFEQRNTAQALAQLAAMKGPERFGNDVIVDGHVVPNMWMREYDTLVELIFPGPVAYQFPKEIAAHAAHACAKAMAVGAGYSHVSSTHATTKTYGPKAICLSEVPTK
jgi:hypothetical protein